MNEQMMRKNDEFEIDLKRLLDVLINKAWLIAIVSVVTAILAFAGTKLLITPLYESSAMFYVNNNKLSVGDTSVSISSSDITASKSLVDSYIVILKSRACLNDVIDYAGVNYSYSELMDMVSAEAVNDTEIFRVVITSPDAQEAEVIANAIAHILPKRISSIIEGTSAKIVDYAIQATRPSSPNVIKNTILGFMIGLMLTAGVIVLREIFDITIRSEEDVAQLGSYPILSAVPDMTAPSRGGYYRSAAKKETEGKRRRTAQDKQILVGAGISFGAQESYKLLRTKLQFSFADDSDSHVIGVSSALTGEGKSLSACNLAYSLAQLNKKVLLVDCDMRRPSVATKLSLQSAPGLSNYLIRQVSMEKILQTKDMGDKVVFQSISAGRIPPNPIELLSSERMAKAVDTWRMLYDYVILDLPPVEEVSDALVVSKLVDGVLIVVRQNHCNRIVLENALRQFEFVGAKILGVVLNCVVASGSSYGRKYYKYHKYYRNSYEDSYEEAARMARMNQNGKIDMTSPGGEKGQKKD